MKPGLWWRESWMEEVWEANIKGTQKLIAAVYADHARAGRTAWVTSERLAQRAGLSVRAAKDARRCLEESGFLTVVKKSAQHAATVYELTIPVAFRGADSARLKSPGVQNPSSRGADSAPNLTTTPETVTRNEDSRGTSSSKAKSAGEDERGMAS